MKDPKRELIALISDNGRVLLDGLALPGGPRRHKGTAAALMLFIKSVGITTP